MPSRTGAPYTQILRFPYNREDSLPTYEEATRIVPKRHREIVVNVPSVSIHQWPVNSNSRTSNHHSYQNQVQTPLGRHALPSRNQTQVRTSRLRLGNLIRNSSQARATIFVISVIMLFSLFFYVLVVLRR